jgi:hypothetical protein
MDHVTFAQLLGNYGEFLGAIGVMVTLIYLSLQLRQNTKSNNGAIVATHLQAYGDTIRVAGASLEAARTMRLGCTDPESLTNDELSQFAFLQGQWFLAWDALHTLHQDNLLPASQWHRVRSDICNGMALPGVRKFYDEFRNILSPEFQNTLDHLIEDHQVNADVTLLWKKDG